MAVFTWFTERSEDSRFLAFTISESTSSCSIAKYSSIYAAINMDHEAHYFDLPPLAQGLHWHVL